jgi:hypothetical protein
VSPLLLTLIACDPGTAGRYRAFVHVGDGQYDIQPRSISALTDPYRLDGELGTGNAGGTVGIDWSTGRAIYDEGKRLRMQYAVQSDIAEPLDMEALILFSLYGNLQDARDQLTDLDIELGELFPLNIAISPALPDPFLGAFPADNEAYVPGTNTMIVLPDLTSELPLAANAGVVFHEFGHGLFHLLTAGDVYAERFLGLDEPAELTDGVGSLDEGFADMLGTLLTDDPGFISRSLFLPERDVDNPETAAIDVLVLPGAFSESGLLASYNPYPLGTVFASVTWDLRLATDDPGLVLQWAVEAIGDWSDGSDLTAYLWLDALVSIVDRDRPSLEDDVCASIGTRFAQVWTVAQCR